MRGSHEGINVMADVASLAVGLHLNAASFKSQLLGAYGDAENQSRRFNRNAQADAKKTEDAYKKVGLSISGWPAGWRGWQEPAFPSHDRHHVQTIWTGIIRPAGHHRCDCS